MEPPFRPFPRLGRLAQGRRCGLRLQRCAKSAFGRSRRRSRGSISLNSQTDRILGSSGNGGRARRSRLAVVAAGLAVSTILGVPARGALPPGRFGPALEPEPSYQGQTRCDPTAKPGVLAFQKILLRNFPSTGSLGISRACNIGGISEHKEGRAWDWAADVSSKRDRVAVSKALGWLLATDRYGNTHARARRFGIMYLIWNRRIWTPWEGWHTYCVQKGSVCRDPDDGDIRSPHTNHVHFSFTWDGAMKRTTHWHRQRSKITAVDSLPSGGGYWLAGGNGSVFALGPSEFLGDKGARALDHSIAAMTSTPTGDGYRLVTTAGRVFSFGIAPKRGSLTQPARIVDIASTQSGRGYWLAGRRGRTYTFGDAVDFGRAPRGPIAGMAVSPSGEGYWLAASSGRVFHFGDAPRIGGVAGQGMTVADIGALPPTGESSGEASTGYWLVTPEGRVYDFGAADHFGDKSDVVLPAPIVGIAPTPSGHGYWLASAKGRMYPFGDATSYGSATAAATQLAPEQPSRRARIDLSSEAFDVE
jgi:hypothetical protein